MKFSDLDVPKSKYQPRMPRTNLRVAKHELSHARNISNTYPTHAQSILIERLKKIRTSHAFVCSLICLPPQVRPSEICIVFLSLSFRPYIVFSPPAERICVSSCRFEGLPLTVHDSYTVGSYCATHREGKDLPLFM